MNTPELLTAARDLIIDPDHHARGCFMYPTGLSFDRLCAIGAIIVAAGYDPTAIDVSYLTGNIGHPICEATHALCRAMNAIDRDGHPDIGDAFEYNDTHPHTAIITAFNTAILNEQARVQEHHTEPAAQPQPAR